MPRFTVSLDLYVEAPDEKTAAATFLDTARDSSVIVRVTSDDGYYMRIDTEDYSPVSIGFKEDN